MNLIRITYDDQADLDRKLAIIMERRGYTVTRRDVPPITVGALALQVGRSVASVSRSLHRPVCPPFDAIRGNGAQRRRILRLVPNDRLLAYLSS